MIREKQLQRRHTPPEIVEEILSKLPVKSLNRFRSVSTSWQSLISSHRFIRKHLMNAESALFQKTLVHHEYLNTLPLYAIDTTKTACPRYLPQGQPNFKWGFWRAPTSCDGLICREDDARYPEFLIVWNPCMRIYKHIPNYSIGHAMLEGTSCYGIGYDATRDDYKIMKLSKRRHSDTSKTEIYSLKNDSWTRADDFPGDISLEGCESVFLNDAIHWLDTRKKSIFSFDLSRNKYKEIPLPKYELVHDNYSPQIRPAALRGMLYVLVNDTSGLILWGLKEDYRDQNSWTRMLAIPLMVVLIELGCPLFFKLLYVYENGEFLIGAASLGKYTEMIICKDSKIIFRQRTPHHANVIRDGIVQVESLISLAWEAKIVM